jgi:Bacteriophage Lambda NinG protein.
MTTKICEICGKEFVPRRRDQRCCLAPECTKERQRRTQREYRKRNYAKVLENNRKTMKARREREKRKKESKKDTIVAIGYADRQRAETLAMAGKVRTEL